VTPQPKVDPAVERARGLAEIGHSYWGAEHRSGEIMFARECYMKLDLLFELWSAQQHVGASSMPASFGHMRIEIPGQGVSMTANEPSPDDRKRPKSITTDGAKLEVRCGGNAWSEDVVVGVNTGHEIYYRVVLHKSDTGGNKTLYQQVVIQDGGRHIVITGSGNAMIRAELVPKLEALVKQLPGMPGEHNDRASA
jgi:hypothetical protein